MPGRNHRTWQTYHVGHFSATIELDPIVGNRNLQHHKDMAQATSRLIALMDSHDLPATWAMSDPAHAPAASQILRSAGQHEFAILGDAWFGATAGRSRFAQELSRCVASSRAAGIRVQTFVPRATSVQQNIDLLVKQQIIAVSGTIPTSPTMPRNTAPRALHYGVWELPVSAKLPGRSGWFTNHGWSTWRRIRRSASDAGMFHLFVEASAICQDERLQKAFARLIGRVANLRDRGLVRVETLKSAAERLSDVPAVKPQQSILRRAA